VANKARVGQLAGMLAVAGGTYLLWQRQSLAQQPNRQGVPEPPRSRALQKDLPSWLTGAAVAGAFASFLYCENRHPLRRQTGNKARRDLRNLAVALLAAVTLRLAEKPVTDALTDKVHRRRWGLLKQLPLPAWLEVPAAVLLLDYSMYVWHVLTHRVSFLWRFHRVHHADMDLDMSTATRFHFGEMLLSVPWRAMQIALIGVSRLSLSIWQTSTVVAILFHHSNSRLPARLERFLSWLFMTPRMHGIHHSVVDDERNSNWSTIFSFPDYLHGTRRFDIPQDRITIGLPAPREEDRLTLGRLLIMPFRRSTPEDQISVPQSRDTAPRTRPSAMAERG
jgi:sterol desaturase/sphingolipid hydroxylase (fatty acid hydroxylase superfamily)